MENAIWIEADDGGRLFNIDFITWVEDEGSYGIAEGETVDGELVKGRISVEDMNKVRKHDRRLVEDGCRKRVRILRQKELKHRLFQWLKPTGGVL